MARIREDQPLVPSVLDRLLDDEPGNQQEPPKSRNQVLREMKLSVRRDLENLLNTRWRCLAWPPDLDQLDASLVNYGLPDFTGVGMATPQQRDHLRRVVEQTVRRFEPRLRAVKVVLLENPDDLDRTLRFRIDGLLYVEPAPEPVVFDSQLEPVTSTFEVISDTR